MAWYTPCGFAWSIQLTTGVSHDFHGRLEELTAAGKEERVCTGHGSVLCWGRTEVPVECCVPLFEVGVLENVCDLRHSPGRADESVCS